MNKIKRNKRSIIITIVGTLIYLLTGIILWRKLPGEMVVNYAFDGSANTYASKAFAVFVPGIFILAMQCLVAFGMGFDPEEKGISDKIYRLCLWIVPAASVFASIIIYGGALGRHLNVQFLGLFWSGFIFIAMGNYIPKVKKNYFVGYRTPWALNTAENWNATNRFGGWVLFLCGCALLAVSVGAIFVLYSEFMLFVILIGAVLITTVLPIGYSVRYYLKYEGKSKEE